MRQVVAKDARLLARILSAQPAVTVKTPAGPARPAAPHTPPGVQAARPAGMNAGPAPGAIPPLPPWEKAVRDRLGLLESSVQVTQRRARVWKKAFWCTFVACLVTAGTAVAAVSTTTNSFAGIFGEVNKYDENSFVTSNTGTDVAPVALTITGGNSGGAIEMGAVVGAANTAISSGNWYYTATVKELAAGTLSTGTFKVELFVDGVSKGALYMTQATADAAAIEGVTFKWDLGAALSSQSAYVTKITQV